MRLLFDQNLSHRLIALLAAEHSGSEHVRDVGLNTADDQTIWEYAAQQGLAIVSKDSDFQQRALLYGQPPKVVWTRLGNCTTDAIAALLRARLTDLLALELDATTFFLAMS